MVTTRKTKNKDTEEFDSLYSNIDEILNDKDLYVKRKKRVRRTKEELKPNYVDPIEMENLIKGYYETGILKNELADMVQKIGTRLGFAQNFINYSYKEEMIGDAIIKMMTALTRKRFKCDSGYNPFSYFTKVAYRAFQNRIKKEKKEHDAIHRYQEEVYGLLTESGQIPYQKNARKEDDGSDHYDESLSTFNND
jgi:hypothetical protein